MDPVRQWQESCRARGGVPLFDCDVYEVRRYSVTRICVHGYSCIRTATVCGDAYGFSYSNAGFIRALSVTIEPRVGFVFYFSP